MDELRTHEVPADVDPDEWTLAVTGTVDNPLAFSRDELAAMPLETVNDDFACVDGWIATDLTWRGVPLETVLDRAVPTTEGEYGLVRAMDGDYACSFPLEALSASILALELDGEPLPIEHGGPARLVPGSPESDCWEHVKWVSEVRIGDAPFSAPDTAKRLALSRTAENVD